jgi:predicted TIM-barrel fold metal-dependent hydrolase
MLEHYRAHPQHLILASSFDASRIEESGFADDVIAQIKQDVAQGARMVKVWKNIGLVHKDSQGNFIQIDDPRFQPIWDYLTEAGIPVLAHIGEPRAAWTALDERNPHNDYYKNNPQYHFYRNPIVPSWETVIGARDRWLARNPDLVVVGAHLGSLAYDTDAVAERLDMFPNLYVEPAERFGDLAIQPSDKVRDFFLKYQDRVLYGTDLGTRVPESELSEEQLQAEKEDLIEQRLRVHWEYLTRSDSVAFVRTGTPFRVMTEGLGLPRDVLEKFYHGNAERLLKLDTTAEVGA